MLRATQRPLCGLRRLDQAAFDTVSREIMETFGCPSKFIAIVRQFHDGIIVKILNIGDQSVIFRFPVTKSVKQGCVLAPILFSIMFSAMLTNLMLSVIARMESGPIRYRIHGKLFNLRRLIKLQAVKKVKETFIKDLLFANDCALRLCPQSICCSVDWTVSP